MDGSRLLFLRHPPTNQLDEGILKGGLAFLDPADLSTGSVDDPHHTAERGVVGELEAEPVNAVLLGNTGGRHALDTPQRVEETAAGAQLEINDRILRGFPGRRCGRD